MLNSKLAVVCKLVAAQVKAAGKVEGFSVAENGKNISIGLIELTYSVKDFNIHACGMGKVDSELPEEGKFEGKGGDVARLTIKDVKFYNQKSGMELSLDLLEFDSLSEGVEFLVDLASK